MPFADRPSNVASGDAAHANGVPLALACDKARAVHAALLLRRAAQCRTAAAATLLPDMAEILNRLSTAFDDAAGKLLQEIDEPR